MTEDETARIARRFANQWDGKPMDSEPPDQTLASALPWCIGWVAVVILAFLWGQG